MLVPSADARADSLQQAIHFAKSWRLPGIITESEPLVMNPKLIRYVKDSGLLCMSWGGLNDVPEHAKVIRPLSEFGFMQPKTYFHATDDLLLILESI